MTERERPRFWVIAGVVMLAVAALSAMIVSLPPHDLWWQLRTGGIIAAEHRIPRVDRFSYTARGEPWLVQEWLTCLIFHRLQSGFGFNGLVGLQGVLVVLTIAGIFVAGRMRGGDGLSAMAGAAIVLWAIRPWLAIRPQLFTYAFLAVALALIEAARSKRRPEPLLALIPLAALWANLHSGALFAPVLLAIETAGALGDLLLRQFALRHLALRPFHPEHRPSEGSPDEGEWRWIAWWGGVAVAVTISTLLTPFGIALWSYPGKVLGHPIVTSFITEWQSPDFHLAGLGAVALLIGLVLATMIGTGPRPPLRDYLLLGLLLSMGMMYKRNLPLFVLAAGPVCVGKGAELFSERGGFRIGSWAGVAACLLALYPIATALAGWPGGGVFASQAGMYDFPVGAAQFLEQHPPPGPLWNQYRWGGYLIWRLPDVPVFIDGRAEVYYRKGVFDDYVTLHRLQPGWREALEKYGVRVVLADRASPLAQALQVDPKWRVVYADPVATVLER